MTSKTKISPYPDSNKPDYSHLEPIVEFLLQQGNESINEYIWGNNRTGYFCHLKHDIDFSNLKSHFDFPESIKINEQEQTIDCQNTYSIIRKT